MNIKHQELPKAGAFVDWFLEGALIIQGKLCADQYNITGINGTKHCIEDFDSWAYWKQIQWRKKAKK